MNQAIDVIDKAKEQFISINEVSPESTLVWKSEANFAMQAIHKNDYTLKAFQANPASLRDAIINVASIGLSLNPATAYAYLVPRDGAICLDISYKGLIKMATDTGSIMWCRADVVFEKDSFDYKGPAAAPIHTAQPFAKDRGEIVGVYCIAKTCDSDYLVEVMTEEEIQDIRSKSKSITGNGAKYSPWNTFPNEMRKKAVIKRASKTWPRSDRHEKLANVIEYVNREEGIEFENAPKPEDVKLVDDLLHQKNGAAIDNLLYGDPAVTLKWSDIIGSFAAKGQKGKHKEMVEGWRKSAIEYVLQVAASILETEDDSAIMEAYEEMNEHELILFWRTISPETKINIENKLHDITAKA